MTNKKQIAMDLAEKLNQIDRVKANCDDKKASVRIEVENFYPLFVTTGESLYNEHMLPPMPMLKDFDKYDSKRDNQIWTKVMKNLVTFYQQLTKLQIKNKSSKQVKPKIAKLSEEQLNKFYGNSSTRPLGAFLDACERVELYDENGRPYDAQQPILPDQEIIKLVNWWKAKQNS